MLRTYFHVVCTASGLSYRYLNAQEVSSYADRLPLIPDGVAIIPERGILFVFEWQRPKAAQTSTLKKIDDYLTTEGMLKRLFKVDELWVLFIFEKDRLWVEDLKEEMQAKGVKPMFFLTTKGQFQGVDPRKLWTEEIWFVAGKEGLVSIRGE